MQEGGTSRRDTIGSLAATNGGSLEGFYYAFGTTDAFVIVDLPDNATAAAMALTVTASGSGSIETVVLLTPEEGGKAGQITVEYRPPGP